MFQSNNLSEYLSLLKERENCTIFISVKDEASNKLKSKWQAGLKELGVQERLLNKYRSSYYAIISDGKLLSEKIGQEILYEEGTINNGKISYSILSAGFDAGERSSIKIKDEEYSLNLRGINIVVYDNDKEIVLDSVDNSSY